MSRAILILLPSPEIVPLRARQILCRLIERCRGVFPDALFFACWSQDHEVKMKSLMAPWLDAFPGEITWLAPSNEAQAPHPESAMAMVLTCRPEARVIIVRTDTLPPLTTSFPEIWKSLRAGTSGLAPTSDKSFDTSLRKAVFFDRDGVVNHSPGDGYVLSPDQFLLNEGIREALQFIKARDWLAILVTSQKGVGKGLMTEATLDAIHRQMQISLAESSAAFDGIYVYTGTPHSPHRPKPDPEMILSAAESFFINLRQSWMIGDADRDIEMGKAAGLAGTIRIKGEKPIMAPANYTLEQVAEIPNLLKKLCNCENLNSDSLLNRPRID